VVRERAAGICGAATHLLSVRGRQDVSEGRVHGESRASVAGRGVASLPREAGRAARESLGQERRPLARWSGAVCGAFAAFIPVLRHVLEIWTGRLASTSCNGKLRMCHKGTQGQTVFASLRGDDASSRVAVRRVRYEQVIPLYIQLVQFCWLLYLPVANRRDGEKFKAESARQQSRRKTTTAATLIATIQPREHLRERRPTRHPTC
jgi:hypothetical protein